MVYSTKRISSSYRNASRHDIAKRNGFTWRLKNNHSTNQTFDQNIFEEVPTPFNMIKVRHLTSSPILISYVSEREPGRIGECPSNSPFLKNNGAEAHWF